jgi:hypothetical protein
MSETKGVPQDLVGLSVDPDKEILRLQQMLRAGIRPALANVEIEAVKLSDGKHALVMHIPKSWNPPHQVVFQGAYRFCARDSRGKYFVEVDELRSIFAISGTIAERVKNFRVDRAAKIAAGDAYAPLLDGGRLVLHVVPFSAFSPGSTFPLDAVASQPNKFSPFADNVARQTSMTFDGHLALSNTQPLPNPQRAYTLVSRTGIVEAVASSIGKAGNNIVLPTIEALIVTYASRYINALNSLGLEPPIAVLASFVGVQDMNFVRDFYNNAPWCDMPSEKLGKDQYHFVESIFEAIPADYRETARRMKGTLDHVANAAGHGSSPNFDEAGNYTLRIPGA